MSHQQAVIFDMDGVLIDSYQAHFKSWQSTAKDEGREFTESDFASTFGCTSRETIALIWRDGNYTDQQIAALDDRKEAAFRRVIESEFPAMPGAVELLRSLSDAGFALGVGSSGPPENIELILRRLEVGPLLGAVVTGADVTRGKPDPQVFQIAAERLGVAPAHCAVVEDAPAGVTAARAAGMAAIGLASTGRTREELSGADLTIDTLCELSPEIFRQLLTGRSPNVRRGDA